MPTYHHPKKGQASRTHKGEQDFTTKRGDKVFHRRGHNVARTRRPYQKNGGFAFLPAILAGLLSGGVSYGTQKVAKKTLGLGTHRRVGRPRKRH